MKILSVWLFSFLFTPAFAGSSPPWVAPYLQIQTTLAKDSTEGVAAAAKELGKALSRAGLTKAGAEAVSMETAKTLADSRDRFQKLSELLLPKLKGLVKAHAKGPAQTPLMLAYCPMKKAWWIQLKGDLRNPYYGSEMLECGVEE